MSLRDRLPTAELTDAELRLVAALGETFFPAGGSFSAGASAVDLADAVQHYLRRLPQRERLLLRALFVVFEVEFRSTRRWQGRSFVDAPIDARRRAVEAWSSSRWYFRRLGFDGLRTFLFLHFLSHPTVRSAMGVRSGEAALKDWQAGLQNDDVGVSA